MFCICGKLFVLFFAAIAIAFALLEIFEVKLQLLAACGAFDLTLFEDFFVYVNDLLAGGAYDLIELLVVKLVVIVVLFLVIMAAAAVVMTVVAFALVVLFIIVLNDVVKSFVDIVDYFVDLVKRLLNEVELFAHDSCLILKVCYRNGEVGQDIGYRRKDFAVFRFKNGSDCLP